MDASPKKQPVSLANQPPATMLAGPKLANVGQPVGPAADSHGSTASPPEHFIPCRQAELVELLCAEPGLTGGERDGLRRLAERLSATLHFEYHEQLGALKSDYASFDPDADTVPLFPPDASERQQQLGDLFERFTWLLERANFTRLPQEALAEALAGHSHWGINLEVDFNVFDRLEIYYRGEAVERREHRSWKTLFKVQTEQVPAFERLVVILKLRENLRTRGVVDTEDVHVKLFKDIPKMDLEMLLPGTRVKMSLVDRTKIVLPTLSGLSLTAWKLISGAVAVAAGGMYNGLALCGLVGGSIGYGLRSFHGYLQTKQRYQLSLTESLYYQNLDNNAGVLMRLLDEAEEQENREALLAWFFLWHAAPANGFTADELDRHIEAFLVDKLKRPVDFEVDDALVKLVRFRLVETLTDGRLRAAGPLDALRTLDASWHTLGSRRAA
jgi:hypothetical protein